MVPYACLCFVIIFSNKKYVIFDFQPLFQIVRGIWHSGVKITDLQISFWLLPLSDHNAKWDCVNDSCITDVLNGVC